VQKIENLFDDLGGLYSNENTTIDDKIDKIKRILSENNSLLDINSKIDQIMNNLNINFTSKNILDDKINDIIT
ncbi:16811_t:CDS:1, partial [Cetraspora pellucida]